MPWISAAPIAPLKSVIDDISKPSCGGSTWMNGSLGTGVNVSLNPPGIGRGSPAERANAAARPDRADAHNAADRHRTAPHELTP